MNTLKTTLLIVLALAAVAPPAHAGRVTNIKIEQGSYKAGSPYPEIRVESLDGKRYSTTDANSSLHFQLRAWARCSVLSAAAETKVGVNGGWEILASGWASNLWADLVDGKTVGFDAPWASPAMPGGPVSACNDEVQRRENAGKPAWKSLKAGFKIKISNAYTGEIKVECGAVIKDHASRSVGLDTWIHCLPSPLAKEPVRTAPKPRRVPPPGPQPRSGPSTAELRVTPTDYRGKCPVQVNAQGSFTLPAAGRYWWRVVGDDGWKSPQIEFQAAAGAHKSIFWKRQIEAPHTSGGFAAPGVVQHGPVPVVHDYFQLAVGKAGLPAGHVQIVAESAKVPFTVDCNLKPIGGAAVGGLAAPPRGDTDRHGATPHKPN
jgi:hypothetical protein